VFKRWKIVMPVLGVLFAGATWIGIAVAQKETPKAPDKVGIGQAEATQLLALMDTDKSGKVSKQEFMKFMEAEFDRLDKDKSGELDVKELLQMQRPMRQGAVGK
jgi:hypothetical protein